MKNKIVVEVIASTLHVSEVEAKRIYEKAKIGGECTEEDALSWLEKRFLPNLVWIDEAGYTKMCIDALKILQKTTATDYGSSRQRDLGQLWGDMTRGYLAEYAFVQWLEHKWGVQSELSHEHGEIAGYLASDIGSVFKPLETQKRRPYLKLSIKGTKWNGIWLDIPGAQFHHSDVHILVKVGVSRDHLFAYFKSISVFRDKVLQRAVESGFLTSVEADSLFSQLPQFTNIPAYICGFATHDDVSVKPTHTGKKGVKHYTITAWRGPLSDSALEVIRRQEGVDGQIKFEGIGRFSHHSGFLFNTGNLLWEHVDWEKRVITPL